MFTLNPKAAQPPGYPRPKLFFTQTFDYKPQMCSVTCSCSKIAFVQLIRFVELDPDAFKVFQVNDEQEERMLRDDSNIAVHGWSLDRQDGRTWPYYGWNDDGTQNEYHRSPHNDITLDTGQIQLGQNGIPTVMWDAVGDERDRPFRVDIVQAPICIAPPESSCRGQVLGYYGSSFEISPNGAIGAVYQDVTFSQLPEILIHAVRNWNLQSNKEQLTNLKAYP